MSIRENIERIRREIDQAARETGRTGADITLVGASKMNDAETCQGGHRRRHRRAGREPGAGDDRQAGAERL